MQRTKDFDKILLEAVDEGLSFLGESGKHMVLFHLERNYSISRYEIPKNPEVFIAGLERIFGAAASVLEKIILKCMYSKLGLKYEEKEGQTLTDCLKEVAAAIERSSQKTRETEEQHKSFVNFARDAIESYQSASESQLCVGNETFEVNSPH
jgi:hypothetical protein